MIISENFSYFEAKNIFLWFWLGTIGYTLVATFFNTENRKIVAYTIFNHVNNL